MRTDPIRSTRRRAPLAAALLCTLAGCAGSMSAPLLPYGQPSAGDVGLTHINGPVLQDNPSRTLSEVVGTYCRRSAGGRRR